MGSRNLIPDGPCCGFYSMSAAQARRPPLGTQLFRTHVAIDFIRSSHVTMATLMWVAHWT